MMKLSKTLLTVSMAWSLTSIVYSQAWANDLADAPKLAKEVCSKCHGMNGNSSSSLFPRLAGQTETYLENQLKSFREHSRGDSHAKAYMWGIAGPLTDGQIKGLAAYFSNFPPATGTPTANPELAAKGNALFHEGVPSRDIPACNSCHGENAEGNEAFPRLAGQHYDYLVRQLQAFHGLVRENEIMDENAKGLNEDDIIAIAEYLSSQ